MCRLWAAVALCLLICSPVVLAPRPAKTRDRSVPLEYLRHVEPKTVALHARALDEFQAWLDSNAAGSPIATLVAVPFVLASLVAEFGI